jgi:serine/threonine protein kinase
MAPEMYKREIYGLPADVWALGLVLVELVHGERLISIYQRANGRNSEALNDPPC